MCQYILIKSKRKTVSISVKQDLTVIVRAPIWISTREVEHILAEKEDWINKKIAIIKRNNERINSGEARRLTTEDIKNLANDALEYIPKRVEYFASIMNVTYGRITIRNQKTRWGSCSSKGNLNFNCLLMMAPIEVIDYVIVHELCHRKEMNHSKAFWFEVSKIIPNYKEYENWLKKEGHILIACVK